MSEEGRNEKAEYGKMTAAFFMAWGNFLNLPCPRKIWDERARGTMLAMLPAVGLIAGLSFALLGGICLKLTGKFGIPMTIPTLIMTFYAYWISGFMHLDGFMDCMDAIMSRRDIEERRRILKDSNVGAFAVISLVFLILGAYIALLEISNGLFREFTEYPPAYILWQLIPLVFVMIASRGVSGYRILSGNPMDSSQYAKNQMDRSEARKELVISFAISILFAVLLTLGTLFWTSKALIMSASPSSFVAAQIGHTLLRIAVATIATCAVTWAASRLAEKNLGGMNGDIGGFAICAGELAGLLALAIVR